MWFACVLSACRGCSSSVRLIRKVVSFSSGLYPYAISFRTGILVMIVMISVCTWRWHGRWLTSDMFSIYRMSVVRYRRVR